MAATFGGRLSAVGAGNGLFLFALKHVERAGRIDARRSPDELDHLPKLGGAELRPFMRPAAPTALSSVPPGSSAAR